MTITKRSSQQTIFVHFCILLCTSIITPPKRRPRTTEDSIRESIKSRIWSIEWRHFQWPLATSTPSFKVTPFFDAKYLRNGTTYIHSVIKILIGTYTRLTQQCHFEWSWVILSDLAKYSMTGSVARSLCDSWASCYWFIVFVYAYIVLRAAASEPCCPARFTCLVDFAYCCTFMSKWNKIKL